MNSEKESLKSKAGKKSRARIIISGRVQGVFFRAYTRDQARQLSLTGWVRNNADGTVEILVEGDGADLQKMVGWCHRGPSSARVQKVDVSWEEYHDEFRTFEVC